MKKMKKMIALLIAAVMIVSMMSVTAFAAVPDDKITITGLTEGDSVTFYQVLAWDGTEDAEYAGWNLVAPFDNAGTALGYADNAALIEAMVGDPNGNPSVPFGLTSEIAGKLAKLATSGEKGPVVAGADGKVELAIDGTTNTIGMYMAIIDPVDDDTVYNPVFVSADYVEDGTNSWKVDESATYSNKSAAKKSTVEVDKSAKIGKESFDQTWTSTRIGEVVDYTVKTTIPGYGDVYQAPHFVITDKLTDLELVDDPAITLVKPANLTAGTDYEIKPDADKKGYTVEFKADYLKKVTVPTDVEITYSAVVTSDAHLNVNLEKNEVWVEFSHDPADETDYLVKKDDTRHYTYTIDADIMGGGTDEIGKSTSEIVKVGVDAKGNPINETTITSQISSSSQWQGPLADAEFKLYTDQACTQEYTKADGTTFTGLKSTADGRIKIEGLDATNANSVYYLKETKAPTGFIAQTDPIKIEIIPTFETKTFTEYWNGTAWVDSDPTGTLKSDSYEVEILKSYTVKINDSAESTHTFVNDGPHTITWSEGESKELPSSIVNTQGVELPSTGGMGTTLFYAIGAALVIGAGVLLVTRRRMSANR